ncbi:2-hydroxy-6-ketonona-24-dienedioic acid hydrolase [Plesiocystis pacifica SIR-1]|uniref:2-hydroxy-6-ketonona-24-dienedioic acid hydrolase n=1 Tax=Plesiocystis pacifica SIR-1 TaxID=391625 RepID=A6GKN4_9BACT|nr:alpha/beta hydrolase [Plesiocystis pacifica]EDM73569.1 2-hydroxy-6-ketonona-24-dienedioic acid hydrolase [Plesiocystis pacifica SIR-1]
MSPTFEQVERDYFSRRGVEAVPRRLALERLDGEATVWTAGSGPPLLMLPGGPFVAGSLAPLMAELSSQYTVHALERPGVGLSSTLSLRPGDLFQYARMLVEDTLAALELDEVTLLGNSLGATMAIVHTLARPETVAKLILVSPPAGVDREIPAQLKVLSRPLLGKLLLTTVGKPSIEATKTMFAEAMVEDLAQVPEDLIELQTQAHLLPGAWMAWWVMIRGIVDSKGLRPDVELFEELPKLSVPTVMLWGALDKVTPPSRGEPVMRTIPNFDLRVIEGAGHMMWIDQEQATLEALRELVA